VAIAAAVAGNSAQSGARPAKAKGLIAFLRAAEQPPGSFVDDRSLFAMRADGSHARRVSVGDVSEGDFSWSPDGKRIVFVRAKPWLNVDDPVPVGTVYVANADGTQRRTILRPFKGKDVWSPAWSPDGKKIALISDRPVPPFRPTYANIWTVKPDGSGLRNLTEEFTKKEAFGDGDIGELAWSPDGRRLAFATNDVVNSVTQIYTIDANGRNLRRIMESPMDFVTTLACSPNGQILYEESKDPGNEKGPGEVGVFVMDTDGGNRHELAHADHDTAFTPAFSPDGKKIAFLPYRYRAELDEDEDIADINLVNSDGSGRTTLANGVVNGGGDQVVPTPLFAWSADGQTIVLASYEGGKQGVYLIGANGKNRQRLTHNNQSEGGFAWQPRHTR
jgi:Tol biopolymer transport system component